MRTDNRSLRLKVELRKRIIDRAGFPEFRVLDLFAGEGLIWKEIRRHRKLKTYTPVDKEPRMKGTIKALIDGRFLQSFDMTRYNVVDVDTYGEPWLVWTTLFHKIQHKTIFFLTHGAVSGRAGANISKLGREILGIPLEWPIPQKKELAILADRYVLFKRNKTSEILSALMSSVGNVTYYGLICRPIQLQLKLEKKRGKQNG